MVCGEREAVEAEPARDELLGEVAEAAVRQNAAARMWLVVRGPLAELQRAVGVVQGAAL